MEATFHLNALMLSLFKYCLNTRNRIEQIECMNENLGQIEYLDRITLYFHSMNIQFTESKKPITNHTN